MGDPPAPPPHTHTQTSTNFPCIHYETSKAHNSSQCDDHIRSHKVYLLSTLNSSIQVYRFVLMLGLGLG